MWELLTEPTENLFNSAIPKKEYKATKVEQLQGQVDSQEIRIKGLEDILENIIKEAENHGSMH